MAHSNSFSSPLSHSPTAEMDYISGKNVDSHISLQETPGVSRHLSPHMRNNILASVNVHDWRSRELLKSHFRDCS